MSSHAVHLAAAWGWHIKMRTVISSPKGGQTSTADIYALLISINPHFSVYANGWLEYISPGLSSLKNLAK